MKITDLKSAVNYLKSFTSYEDIVKYKYGEKVFDLERFKKFLNKYCPDYEKLKVIHVAGSKGKGTTANLIASYLNAAGYKTGIFNSPYIVDITESISVGGKNISVRKFIEYVKNLKSFLESYYKKGNQIPYFELLTAIAFKFFIDKKADFTVLEVGLGGRLDSTNVCRPVLTVLTRIEKEHTELLGKNYGKILNEKLGIVKEWNIENKIPLIVAPQNRFVSDIIGKRRLKVPIFYVNDLSDVLSFDSNYQTALTALLNLNARKIIKNADRKIFDKVYFNLKLIGHFDVRKISGRAVIFDMAHTSASAKFLCEKLFKKFGRESGKKKEFVFLISMMKFKNVKRFLREILRLNPLKIVFTSSHKIRGYKGSELKKIYEKAFRKTLNRNGVNIVVEENPLKAFRKSLSEIKSSIKKRDQILVVTGSHFLISKILSERK